MDNVTTPKDIPQEIVNIYLQVWIQSLSTKIVGWLLLIFPNFTKLLWKQRTTYLRHIKELKWCQYFKHLFLQNWEKADFEDITKAWSDSCAYFVSNILCFYWMIDDTSATVTSLKNRLTQSEKWTFTPYDWLEIPVWSVVFWKTTWENTLYTSDDHVWFVIDSDTAISNSSYTKCIEEHPVLWTQWNMKPTWYFIYSDTTV